MDNKERRYGEIEGEEVKGQIKRDAIQLSIIGLVPEFRSGIAACSMA